MVRGIYVQDNVPYYKSTFRMNDLNKINILFWPATSPDLNPIENVWNIIDKKLKNYRSTTVNNLQQINQKSD
jgi:transposase